MSRSFSEADVETFAQVSRDFNPIHLDAEYARQTKFGRKVAHGMLAVSQFSAIIGTKFPGEGSIYLGQDLKFSKPIFIDEPYLFRVTITHIREDKPIYTLETVCLNQDGEPCIEGTAVVLFKS